MALISIPETPAGVIDGVNRVFTFANPINTFIWIRIDGLLYVGGQTFTVGSPVLTVDVGSAPTSSIYAIYYTSTPPAPPPTPFPRLINLQQAYDALKNLLKDISDVPLTTFIQWCDFINAFTYRYLLGVDPDRFLKQVSFPITTGVSTYALQSDFRDMETWNTGFFITNNSSPSQTLSQRLPLAGPGVGFPGYYISRGNYIFSPTPTQNITLTQIYAVVQAPLFDIGQYFTLDGTSSSPAIIEYEYLQYVVRALAQQYMVWDEEVGAESYADARFVRALDELCENIRRQPQAMGMLDFSPIYGAGNGGFGNWGAFN